MKTRVLMTAVLRKRRAQWTLLPKTDAASGDEAPVQAGGKRPGVALRDVAGGRAAPPASGPAGQR